MYSQFTQIVHDLRGVFYVTNGNSFCYFQPQTVAGQARLVQDVSDFLDQILILELVPRDVH